MWDLSPNLPAQLRSALALPLITLEHSLLALLGLVLLKVAADKCLRALRLAPHAPHALPHPAGLEYSPVYHLAIVVLVLSEVEWNMFDLAVWAYFYVGAGVVRRALLGVRAEREAMLGGFAFEVRLVQVLEGAKVAGAVALLGSLGALLAAEVWFAGTSMRVLNLLVFPVAMLAVDAGFMLLSSLASQKDLLCYFNQNINEMQPAYKLELVEKILGNALKLWHFYTILRIFFRALLDKMGVLDYLWIFTILNAAFAALKLLVSSISKYRSYSKLMKKFDRLFRRSTSAPDQVCTVCLAELLNCRQLAACGHLFHYRCLFQWMQTKMECPVCRVPIQLT